MNPFKMMSPDWAIRSLAAGLNTSLPVIKRASKDKALRTLNTEASISSGAKESGRHFHERVKRIEDAS